MKKTIRNINIFFSTTLFLLISMHCFNKNIKEKYRNFKDGRVKINNENIWRFHSMGLTDRESPILRDKKTVCKKSLLNNAFKKLEEKFNTKHLWSSGQRKKIKKAIKIKSIDYDKDYNCEAILEINKKELR